MTDKIEYIKEQMSLLDLHLTDEQAEQFFRYYEILTEWNQVMNLTAITGFEEVVRKHFVDSLAIAREINFQNVDSLIDVGTGAGFPGLPLKIVFPKLRVTLLDSLNKRIRFLEHVVQELDLHDVEMIHGRAEDFAKPGVKREKYDLCVSRAVANLSILCEYCLPYVKVGGYFAAYKSGDVFKELEEAKSAISLLGGKLENCAEFHLPGSDIERSLVKIRKKSECPKKYPRKSGQAAKRPL